MGFWQGQAFANALDAGAAEGERNRALNELNKANESARSWREAYYDLNDKYYDLKHEVRYFQTIRDQVLLKDTEEYVKKHFLLHLAIIENAKAKSITKKATLKEKRLKVIEIIAWIEY